MLIFLLVEPPFLSVHTEPRFYGCLLHLLPTPTFSSSLLLCSSSTSLINYTVRFRAALSIGPLPGRYLRVCSDLASSRKSSRFYFQEWVARARVWPRGASWSCQRGALAVTDGDPALARPCCQPQFDRSNQSGVRPMEGWLEGCWIQG